MKHRKAEERGVNLTGVPFSFRDISLACTYVDVEGITARLLNGAVRMEVNIRQPKLRHIDANTDNNRTNVTVPWGVTDYE